MGFLLMWFSFVAERSCSAAARGSTEVWGIEPYLHCEKGGELGVGISQPTYLRMIRCACCFQKS